MTIKNKDSERGMRLVKEGASESALPKHLPCTPPVPCAPSALGMWSPLGGPRLPVLPLGGCEGLWPRSTGAEWQDSVHWGKGVLGKCFAT